MKEDKSRKTLIYYTVVGFMVILLLNSFLLPYLQAKKQEVVTYNQFITYIDDQKVDKVEVEGESIRFTLKDQPKGIDYYKLGKWDDPGLTDRLIKAKVNFDRVVPEQMSPILSFLVSIVFPILLWVAVGQLLMRSMSKRMGGGNNMMSFGKSNAKVYVKAQTGKTFDDVAGQDEAKESLNEVVDFLHDPKKYTSIGAILPKGVLLVGPPGTGKTLLAQAVAGEAKVPFFSISGSEFVEMFVGMGASKVRDLFKQANEKAPCIVFIDEIDAIGKRRDTSGFSGNDEREQTLNQLLNEMDGFDGSEGVVILAATNRPEILDPALTRPGRFDRQVPVELPDLNGREAILKVHAKKIITDPSIDYREVAKMTAGASGAELANIINEGALRAVREGRNKVLQEDLIESVEVVIAGQQRKSMVISPKEKELIAYHEVGHALVAAMQTDSAPVTKITIIPRTSGALGYTMQVEEDEKFLMSKEDLHNKIVTLTGGRSAEELVFNTKTTGAANDIERATSIARAMVAQYGMTDEFDFIALETRSNRYLGGDTQSIASDETAGEIDQMTRKIIASAHMKAIEILKENMDKLHEISRYLIEKETITGEEFMGILNRKPVVEAVEEG